MNYRNPPTPWYKGDDRYPPQFGTKVCIDWNKNKIRMSLIVYPKYHHPNVKKEVQAVVEWLDLNSEILNFDFFDGIIGE